MFILLTMFMLMMFIVKKWTINTTLERVEDDLTMSALGSMQYNAVELSINGNLVLDDNTGNVNDTYKTLCTLLAENLDIMPISNSQFWSFKGTSPYFVAEDGDCYIETAIFYNVRKNNIRVYTYNKSGVVSKTETINANTTTAPTGDEITATSVYLFFHFPMEYYGKKIDVKKAVVVGMDRD